MRSRTRLLFLAIPAVSLLALGSAPPAQSAARTATRSEAVDTRAALEKLDGLVGTWSSVDRAQGNKPNPTTIKRTGGGKTYVHDQGGMITVYHPDGANLILTHYCGAGNQPRMRLDSFDGKKMSFSLLDITNLASPEAYHTNRVEIVFVSEQKVLVSYHGIANGKVQSQTFELTR